ncbi:PREDICTED: uncharacterized protein LOC109225985 [Nicotiana attenuata]|uniref:uncharacterized protein LOC109225985 n=1 Tax=Nicotiana attenuata TaxID=49451 RepID=UPI00090510B8|nr:PREDICTED: uncharacterized protein LOC109225985 [Nicotiana attenuata]
MGSRDLKSDKGTNPINPEYGAPPGSVRAQKRTPQHDIHMIIGGVEDPQCHMSKRTKTSVIEGSTQKLLPKETLIFTEEDLEAMGEPHNDALVISFLLNNTRIKRVLVDPGILTNIFRSGVIEQLGLLSQINTIPRILHGFNMTGEEMKG